MTSILTPVGRMVAGSLYKPNTTDWQGNPLTIKTGPNAGQPRTEYFFALAIQKGGEQAWWDTEWGSVIAQAGMSGFPNNEASRPDFAWKITDGDSTVPNKRNVAPCAKEGYPGHWVLSFSSSFAPRIYNNDGTQQILEPDAVKCGYFIQVSGTVEPNGNPGNPGVYLNHNLIAFAGYGDEIHTGPDPRSVGFGGGGAPAGMSATPPQGQFNPAPQPGQMPGGAPAQMPGQPMAQPAQHQPMPQQPGQMPGQPGMPSAGPVPNPQGGQPPTGPAAGHPPQSPGAAPGATPAMAPAAQYAPHATGAPGAPSAGPGPGVDPNFMGGPRQ